MSIIGEVVLIDKRIHGSRGLTVERLRGLSPLKSEIHHVAQAASRKQVPHSLSRQHPKQCGKIVL